MINEELLEGKYRILKVLGQGGMGKVYLAENIKLGTLWAIKEINKKANPRVDLLVEPNILKKLDHPALPRVFDIIENEENIYVIVDYIEGVSLDKKLKETGKFPEATVIEWAKQICEVMIYLHTFKPNPIIYRDMKPSNIILTRSGTIKLIDFGIAREYKQEAGSDTIYIGTRGYAAPEQYGTGQTDVTTDIYSLGVTLYHLVTGKSPNEPPYEIKPVRYFDKDLSADIENIISKCTRPNPQERYQSAQELLSDIASIGRQDEADMTGPAKQRTLPGEKASNKPVNFKKLVLTVWDNAEFGCELAYMAARLTDFRIMLIDLDLMAPKADLYLNIKKCPDRVVNEGIFSSSGLNIVMNSISKDCLSGEVLEHAAVKRSELRNLFILTGNYKLDNYEYYSDDSLVRLIEKSYQNFDITILLVNRFIYDSYTVISLIKSDFNIIPVRADIDSLREFNSYLVFLKEKQQIPLDKSKFVAFEYDCRVNLKGKLLESVTEYNYLGSIRYSRKRARYRNLKIPFARRMEREILNDYKALLGRFNIIPKITVMDTAKEWLKSAAISFRIAFKGERRSVSSAGNKHTS